MRKSKNGFFANAGGNQAMVLSLTQYQAPSAQRAPATAMQQLAQNRLRAVSSGYKNLVAADKLSWRTASNQHQLWSATGKKNADGTTSGGMTYPKPSNLFAILAYNLTILGKPMPTTCTATIKASLIAPPAPNIVVPGVLADVTDANIPALAGVTYKVFASGNLHRTATAESASTTMLGVAKKGSEIKTMFDAGGVFVAMAGSLPVPGERVVVELTPVSDTTGVPGNAVAFVLQF
jgi:hypothetical protein